MTSAYVPAKSGASVKRVAIGSDHAGYALKEELKAILLERQVEIKDLGTYLPIDLSTKPPKNIVDYPDYGEAVGRAVADGSADLGVCTCGSGIGIGMAANKVPGVRAATVTSVEAAKATRMHNDANVICFGNKSYIDPEVAKEALRTFLTQEFAGSYHTTRVEKLAAVEKTYAAGPAADAGGFMLFLSKCMGTRS